MRTKSKVSEKLNQSIEFGRRIPSFVPNKILSEKKSEPNMLSTESFKEAQRELKNCMAILEHQVFRPALMLTKRKIKKSKMATQDAFKTLNRNMYFIEQTIQNLIEF